MQDKFNLYLDIESHLMEDDKPSEYFNDMLDAGMFNEYPFYFLRDLIKAEQSPKYHPEGNVWKHTMMVVDKAAEKKKLSEFPKAFMWAALLHDIGKPATTKIRKGRITSYDHEKCGAKMARDFLEEFTTDERLIQRVVALVRWHMQPLFVVKNLPFAEVEKMLSEVPIDEISLLCLCDRLGRGEMSNTRIKEEQENIRIFVEKCKNYKKRIENKYAKV